MPRELRTFLIGISVLGTVVGFAAGDRRDPFSFTAAILTIAGLFALTMLIGWLSQPKGVPLGTARLAGRRNESIAAAGTAFQGSIFAAFTAGIEGHDGSTAPWLVMIFKAPEVGPGFRPAATNACHFAFEIGRSVANGLVTHDEAMRLSAEESIRQFSFAADHGRALPPLRQDPGARLPPTLAQAEAPIAVAHRRAVGQNRITGSGDAAPRTSSASGFAKPFRSVAQQAEAIAAVRALYALPDRPWIAESLDAIENGRGERPTRNQDGTDGRLSHATFVPSMFAQILKETDDPRAWTNIYESYKRLKSLIPRSPRVMELCNLAQTGILTHAEVKELHELASHTISGVGEPADDEE
jgi:hypothetical protein